MKRMNLLAKAGLLFAAGATLLFAGCDNGNDDDGGDNGSKKLQLTVNLTAPAGYEASELPSMTVTAVNSDKELTYTETTAAGTTSVTFEVSSGQYQIMATGKYSPTVTFTGSVAADVFGDKTAAVALSEVYESPLVFKEIYSTSNSNYTLTDTYFEIVNNSDEVQYLDGLIVATINPPYPANVNPWESVYPLYPVYGVAAAFPGTGKEHPLQPGESVVIANDAKDWTSNGGTNLSNADWEVYVQNVTIPSADVNYDAPDLTILFNENTQRNLNPGYSKGCFLLAKLPDGTTPEEYASDSGNFMTEPNSTKTQRNLMIPSDYLLDAVEIWDATESQQLHLLLSKDDSGQAAVTGFAGKSIRRKVTKVENGRAYYQDTNNSTDDFLTEQPLTPGVHPTQAD